MSDSSPHERRSREAWSPLRRTLFRNPIVIAVVAGLLINVFWAVGVYAWQRGVDATHEYWRSYGAALVEQARRTDDPRQLRALIERVQGARSP